MMTDNKIITIDEAITHCYDVADRKCDDCGKEHLQLAKYLEELKESREIINRTKGQIKAIKDNLRHYLDTNEENGVVYIPKYMIEKLINGMAERERLIELINKGEQSMIGKSVGGIKSQREYLADYLLANGVKV